MYELMNPLMLWLLVAIPFIAASVAWLASRWSTSLTVWIALCALTVNSLLSLIIWHQHVPPSPTLERWFIESHTPWITEWGIALHLGLDGFSLAFIILTNVLGLVAVVSSRTEIQEHQGFYYFNLLLVISGAIGVFLALDLFLFFTFWELMLLPMYLLIAIWGHDNRRYASFKFFLFTQVSSLLLLVGITALALLHQKADGAPSFDYHDLASLRIAPDTAWWIMLAFLGAFAIKLPVVPFHAWVPDVYAEAPTGASILLAGVLEIPAAYGSLRFILPIFPQAAQDVAPFVMALGITSVLYGAYLAFAQSNLKRLLAYSSISHLGFALIGIFAVSDLALQGAVMQLIAYGISSAALFMLAGILEDRLHTQDMRRMGGLWSTVPRMSSIALFFAVASLGLPGLANFIGEFLVLFGSFRTHPWGTALAAFGMVTTAIYALALIQRTIHGPLKIQLQLRDLSGTPFAVLVAMAAVLICLGWYPSALFVGTEPAIQALHYFEPTR